MPQITSFKVSESDQQTLLKLTNAQKKASNQQNGKVSSSSEKVEDYSDVLVKKPWGYEYLAFDNGQVAIWILHIARKRKTSLHCHPKKSTGLIVLSGSAKCTNLQSSVELIQFQSLQIDKGCFHSTEAASDSAVYPTAENGTWLMEIEAPSNKSDLVRAKDIYGRKGKSYEDKSNTIGYQGGVLKFVMPEKGCEVSYKFYDSKITLNSSCIDLDSFLKEELSTIVVIGFRGEVKNKIDGLTVGKLYTATQLQKCIKNRDYSDYDFLTVVKDKYLMKLSDYVADVVAELGVREVFSVSGGGSMHLIDSIGRHEKLEYIATHHEQAAAMAAEAYSRIQGFGVALFTTGPGGTNALTGVAGAWVDSIPTLFISGQVTRDTLLKGTALRQYGIQETNITELVRPITKYAVTVNNEEDIRYELEKAIYLAKSGRPGPVWIDIPLDIQSKHIEPLSCRGYKPPVENIRLKKSVLNNQVKLCVSMLLEAKRPVIIYGYGVRLSNATVAFRQLIDEIPIPFISSWTASDIVNTDHSHYIGRFGIFGDRASNFSVQNSDLLIVIGSRLSIPQIGYNYGTFAREAKIVMVDIDLAEINKASLHIDLPILSDAGEFIHNFKHTINEQESTWKKPESWLKQCQIWKKKYPVVLPEYENQIEQVNSFFFIDQLSKAVGQDVIIVTDMGTSFTCTMQTFKTRVGQRLTTSSGHASMGFGLPGAIGACFASKRKKTICISGEGGLQMNIQELQTVAHHKLPILIFVLNNGGYLTIKHMQQNHFGQYVGSEEKSGLSFPNLLKIAAAYKIPSIRINNHSELESQLDEIMKRPWPIICEIMMSHDQPLIPRLSSLKKPDGTIVSKPLEDLYPFLDRKEFSDNMLVKSVDDFD